MTITCFVPYTDAPLPTTPSVAPPGVVPVRRASLLNPASRNSARSCAPSHTAANRLSAREAQAIATHFLTAIPFLKATFAREDEIDKAAYADFINAIPKTTPLTPGEQQLLKTSLSNTASATSPWTRIPGTITSSVAYHAQKTGPPKLAALTPSPSGAAVGRAIATIDAAASLVLAWLWCYGSNARIRHHLEKSDTSSVRKVYDWADTHSQVVVNMLSFPLGFEDRIFTTWYAWEFRADGTYVLAFAPMKEMGNTEKIAQVSADLMREEAAVVAVQGTMKGYWEIRPVAAHVCEVTLVQQGDLGGMMPEWLMDVRVGWALAVVEQLQVRRGLAEGELAERKNASLEPRVAAVLPARFTCS